MTPQDAREAQHEIMIAAPAPAVFQLLAEVGNWPRIFPPTIYVDQLERSGNDERIRIWATANGQVKNWTSRRTLDTGHLRIDFRQEVSAQPVAAMGGAWVIEPMSAAACLVRLLHDFRAVDDDPQGLAWISEAVDRNSRSELAALKSNVELAHGAQELAFSFEDTLQVDGWAKDIYDFIYEAGRWPERLPHVATVRLTEDSPGLQTLEMDTRAKDGSVHTTVSYRVCVPYRKIAYKQVTLPALMSLHTGYWTFCDCDSGVAASSQHAVVLNAGNIPRVLGAGATIADAREYVRSALSTNSLATLRHARDYAEKRN